MFPVEAPRDKLRGIIDLTRIFCDPDSLAWPGSELLFTPTPLQPTLMASLP